MARSFSTSMFHVCGFVLSLLVPLSVQALDPNLKISQYARTAWLIQDGYLRGAARAIAQTSDGYLWIGTESGLFRFDGARFQPWTFPDGAHLPSTEIHSLFGAHDGSLWIGTREGVAHLIDQKLVNFPSVRGKVFSILEDPSGIIWFSLESAGTQGEGPICKVSGAAVAMSGCIGWYRTDPVLPRTFGPRSIRELVGRDGQSSSSVEASVLPRHTR